MRYVLDFGAANAGGAPAFTLYKRLDTLADLAQPAIVEIGSGQYYFEVDWTTVSATSITFKATLAGIELSDVVSAPNVALQGTSVASAGFSSLAGYSTVATLVNRAAVQCGLSAVADPFASADPNFVQLREFLDTLGTELSESVNAHLQREFTLTTTGAATSYALPADYREMVDDTAWNRSGFLPLDGPITPARAQFLKSWNGAALVNIPYRIQGNRLTVPIAPADGLSLSGLYVSTYWVQTAASGTGPDADHITLGTDYVLFDPLLVVLGLKLRWLEAKGFDTVLALAAYERRFEKVRGTNAGASTLSMGGGGSLYRLIDAYNAPPTGLGA
jgi:hypothetical protein